jgi:BASS family bile acid:Na+ symporter
MSGLHQFLASTLKPLVLVFTVSNLAAMGLQVRLGPVVSTLRNRMVLVDILLFGWVAGPLLALLLTKALPLAEPHATVLLLASLAPCAPILQQVVGKAKADVGFAGAFIPVVTMATVILMPLLAPVLIPGLTVDPAALAKPLLLTILMPLVLAAALRHFADAVATRLFQPTRLIAVLSTLGCGIWCLGLFGEGIIRTAGSIALPAMTVFMVAMGAMSYRFSFGLTQAQRSVMALGIGAQNGAAMFAAALAIPNADARILDMVVMWVLWETVLTLFGAKILARLADRHGRASAS